MTAARVRLLACRLPVAAFCVTTSIYGLLAYIPFTYQQVIEFRLVGGLSQFAQYHPWLAAVAWGLAACSLIGELRRGPRGLAVGFILAGAFATAALLVRPVLTSLANDSTSLVWAAAALVPLAWLAIIDWVAAAPALDWQQADTGADARLVRASIVAGLGAAALASATLAVRLSGEMPAPWPALAIPWLWSLAYHLVVFIGIASLLLAVRAVAALARRQALVEFALVSAAGAACLAFVVYRIVLSAVSLVGPLAMAISVVFALILVLGASGLVLRLWPEERPVTNGLELATYPLGGSVRARWLPVTVSVLILTSYVLTASAAAMDWNYLLQKLSSLCVWLGAFAVAHGAIRTRAGRAGAAVTLLVAAAAGLGGYRALHAFQPAIGRALAGQSGDVAALLDRYAGYDASFRIAHDELRVEPPQLEEALNLYPLLQRHTNIPRTVTIDLPDVSLVDRLTPGRLALPHIFVIVVDSLRQDYLSPYNPQVTFTPEIAEFARDSHVFRQAFSRYGATGLSEPAIWAGGMLPHQQYPANFSRVNALQKLVVAEAYDAFVSVDTPLRATGLPWPGLTELDAGRPNKDYKLCGSLEELQTRLRARPAGAAGPVFAYTQPQDIHISTITREGKGIVGEGDYGVFYAPYASRIRRMDGCFGSFIDTLRETGLYDQSLVVLTSDHGDSLGEDGRWGHAYTVFPEIVRVPLIVRLPPSMRKGSTDADALAFTTDITPSLYRLLGHGPTLNHPLFGRPLFVDDPREGRPYLRDSHVVASSYGPVYGWINDRGRSLYILDAISYRDYAYDLTTGTAGTAVPVTAALRTLGGKQIQATIQELARFYRIPLDH